MLARLQQFITLFLLLAATNWLLVWWPDSRLLALSGFASIALGYSVFLAFEFTAVHFLNRKDPRGQATWFELLRAWWGETRTAPQVFFWRQPFRSQAVPDFLPRNGRRGVVLVHGFICNRGLWNPWMRRLHAQGQAFAAVTLEPVFGSIDDYVPLIEDAVQRVHAATGLPPVVVCHSMGGLATRAWLRHVNDDARVHQVITIGTPHHGTWLGRFSYGINGSQMQLDSPWLQQLERDEPKSRYSLFTCWYSNCDNIVFPASTALLPGAQHRHLGGVAHVSLAFHPEVISASLNACSEVC